MHVLHLDTGLWLGHPGHMYMSPLQLHASGRRHNNQCSLPPNHAKYMYIHFRLWIQTFMLRRVTKGQVSKGQPTECRQWESLLQRRAKSGSKASLWITFTHFSLPFLPEPFSQGSGTSGKTYKFNCSQDCFASDSNYPKNKSVTQSGGSRGASLSQEQLCLWSHWQRADCRLGGSCL